MNAARGEQLAADGGFDLTLSAQARASVLGYYEWGRVDIGLTQALPLWGSEIYAGWRLGRGETIPSYYGQYETLDLGELRAGLTIPLFRDGPIDARRARIWRAEHATEAQRAQLRVRMLELRLASARAYWGWVAAGRRYLIAANLLDLAEQRDHQISARVAAGAIPRIESLENRRVVLSRRTSLVSARRALESAAIALSIFYRRENGAPRVALAPRVPTIPRPVPEVPSDIERQISIAWAARPERLRYAALLRRQQVSVDLAHNRLAPQIDLSVGARADLGGGTSAEEDVLGPAVLEGALTISFPVQFREARGGVRRTRAELSRLRAELQLLRERIAVQVRDAGSAVHAAAERLILARDAAHVAELVADAERQRFELGATQLFIVNLREQAAAVARAVLVDAEAAAQIAAARWQAAIGAGLAQNR